MMRHCSLALIVLSVSSVFQLTSAALPVVTGLSHSLCAVSGDSNDADIYGCPVTGGGLLNVTGTDFSVDVVNITSVCLDTPVYVSTTLMQCTLNPGIARSVTASPTAILSNGSFVESSSPRVHYAYAPVVTGIRWTGEGCLSSGSSWPYVFTRCPFDGAVSVTLSGTNFQSIGPLAGITFYSIGQSRSLCQGNMNLGLSQSLGGGIQTTLVCSFVADTGIETTMTNGILLTNGGNFSIFTSLTFNGPPVITLLEVPTSTQVTPTSVIDAPVQWTLPSPNSARVGVRATNLVQMLISGYPITMTGCAESGGRPTLSGVDILNCTFIKPPATLTDVVVTNSLGFGRTRSNAGVNVTTAPLPILTAIRSEWCFQTSDLSLYNCPIFDTTFLITFIGSNFDQYFSSDACVVNTMIRVNRTYAYCNSTVTNQDGAGRSRDVRISTNGVTQWGNIVATIVWAPRPTFSSLSMSSCLVGATPKFLIGCPIFGSYISLNQTQILSFTGTNFYKGPASIQIGSAAQIGAQPCIPGTIRVVSAIKLECEFNLQYPLDQMIQTSILVAGGWTDVNSGGGGIITFAAAPTVTAVDIPLCTFNSLVNNYTNCPFDGHSPNITVTGTQFNAGPVFTTIMLTSTFEMVCNPVIGSTITAITGANAYTTLTCQLIRDSAAAGGSILPAGKVYTNGGNATIWTSLTYAMWPIVTLLASEVCQSASPLSLVDCPVSGNSFAPAVLNITTSYLQPDSVVSMDGYGCQSFDRSQGVNNIVCRLNYSSSAIGGVTATTAPLTIRNPVGYGYTQTLANVTFAFVPIISSLSLSDCDMSAAATLINCPVDRDMAQLTIIGDHFTGGFNVSTNVCVAGSVIVNSTTSAFCTAQRNTSNVLSELSVTSYGVAGYTSTSASIRYAPLPVISAVSNSLCTVSPTPRTLSSCPLSGSTLSITGLNIAVGPYPHPNITLFPNPDNITPCVFNTTRFDPAGTWISCEIIDLTQSVSVQVRGILDNITITTTGGTSLTSAALSYQPLPVITSLSSSVCANNGSNVLFGCPVNVDGTALLTIYGVNFLQGSTVVDSTICTTGSSLTVVSTTMITCPLANFTGLGQIKSIIISNPALYGGGNGTFIATVQATTLLAPTVTGLFNPDCGQAVDGVSLIGCPTLGGGSSTLTIIGTNFDVYLPTHIPFICEDAILVVNQSYGLCSLASQIGSSVWMATISTNGGSTTNSLVTLQYAVSPILDQLLVAECVGNGTDILYECPTSGGQLIWFRGSNFIGSMFNVVNNQQAVICRTGSIIVYNSTTASCLLAADSSYIGTTVTSIAVRTFGGLSLHTFTLGFVYPPIVTEVTMNGCSASLSTPEAFSLCPFDPLYNLSIIVKGSNFTQGLIPHVSVLVSRTSQFCDDTTLFINRTIIMCMINPSLANLAGSVVPVVEVQTQAGYSTVFTQLSFSNRVSITSVQSSMCVVDGNGGVSGCPVVGNSDSPFTVTLSVLNLQTSTPSVANGVCSRLVQPSAGTLVCTVNETLARPGASLPIVIVDSFGYMDTSDGVARAISIARIPSVSTFSGMDSACKQKGVAGLQDCPTAGGNSVVFNGLYFDSWFQASICDPSSISLISSTQVVCELVSKAPSYSEVIQISTHGTAGWINSTAQVSFASVPSITNISSHQCNQVAALDIDDCPFKAGAQLNITGQFLNGGALRVVSTVGAHDVCISNTVSISVDGTWMSCIMSDFTAHLPTLKWQLSLSTNGGIASQNASFEWWPLPRLLSLSSSVCRSFNPTTLVDCPLEAGVAMTVNGENFKPDVTVSDPTDCISLTYVNSTQFVCFLAYRPRSAVDLVVVTNPRGYGESLEIASITSSPLAFPIITAFNNTACSRSTSNAGSLFNCSNQSGQMLTIIGENFDVNNPVYVHDVCGASGPVAISVVSTELAYCPGTIRDASFAGGVFPAHIQTNGGEAIFPRVTITWFALVAPLDLPASQSSSTSPLLTGLPSNSLQVNEQGNFTLRAPAQKGYPIPSISWEVSYDNATWTIITGANTSSLAVSDVQSTMIGAIYRPVYTNSLGAVAGESIAIYVEVMPRPIDQPPVNVTTAYGTTTTLNATLLGHPIPEVQWQYLSTSGAWVNVSGSVSLANTSTVQSSLTLGNQSEYLRQYRTCYSNAFGANCSVPIPVYAEQFPRDIVTQSVNVTSQIGQPRPSLTSTVYGYPAPTVQWFRSNGTGMWIPVVNGTRTISNSSDPATIETSLDLPAETESGTTYYRVCYTNVAGTNCSDAMTVTTIEAAAEPDTSSASSLSKGAVAGVVIGAVFGALLICLILYVLLAAALARRGPAAQDGGVAPASGAATSGPSSWFAGALCGLAEPQAKQKGAAHDIDFGA